MWYPQNKHELNRALNQYLKTGKHKRAVTGLIVPHAGYEFSGAVAGKAFSLIKKRIKKGSSIKETVGVFDKAIIIGPSHYVYLFDALTSNREFLGTPLGKIKLFNTDFLKGNIDQEHSITNQIPFLQKIGVKQVMPLMIGKITNEQAEQIAKKLAKIKAIYIFSTDLSHFLSYGSAVEADKKTIEIIEKLDFENFKYIDACGTYPLLIMFHLCKLKKTNPKLIEYKNSGDILGDKSTVVGYASFYF